MEGGVRVRGARKWRDMAGWTTDDERAELLVFSPESAFVVSAADVGAQKSTGVL